MVSTLKQRRVKPTSPTLGAALIQHCYGATCFMIGGAIVSAMGAALAGVLKGETQRKVAAVVGAIGAIVTVLPKAPPDKEALQAQLSAAEKHRVFGTKVRNQFQFAKPDESINELQKYVSARFTDCSSLSPPAQVPDLPAPSRALTAMIDSSKSTEELPTPAVSGARSPSAPANDTKQHGFMAVAKPPPPHHPPANQPPQKMDVAAQPPPGF